MTIRILLIATLLLAASARGESFRVATFEADITIPIGHACMGGGIANARRVVDPLYAKGFVLLGEKFEPVVVVALDWCQCNNDSYDRWRDALAEAANTARVRVMLATVHQHDAPICDLRAQAILDTAGFPGSICDAEFHERAVERVAAALRDSLAHARPVDRVGFGQARVERIASNRRVHGANGKLNWDRSSASTQYDAEPEGEIDPFVKTISLWAGDRAVVSWSCYAVHPMSHYGKGEVSADFVGMARKMRQADDRGVFQMYFTGCGGDTTAGKYNDGKPEEREQLARRLYDGMNAAWKDTTRVPIDRVEFRSRAMKLSPRIGGDFDVPRMKQIVADPSAKRWARNCAALGLSWRERVDAGHAIDVPCLDLGGKAQFVVLPAETFVGYQLAAQKMRPDGFVMVTGFGDGAPGYIPTEACWRENYEDPYCWVTPACATEMLGALSAVLKPAR